MNSHHLLDRIDEKLAMLAQADEPDLDEHKAARRRELDALEGLRDRLAGIPEGEFRQLVSEMQEVNAL